MNHKMATATASSLHTTRRKPKFTKILFSVIIYALLILTAILCIGPFLWMLLTALKTPANIYEYPPSLSPSSLTLNNFKDIFEIMPLSRYILNTIVMSSLGIFISLVIGLTMAYPLARIKFPGRQFIFLAIVSTMILPNSAGMIVNFLTIKDLGLYNSVWGVVLPTAVTVFTIFLLRQAFLGIPDELAQSARIDGAGEFRTFWSIMVPLVKPAISTVVIFDFMNFWNSLIWPVIVFDDQIKFPLSPALQYLQGTLNYNFAYVAAGTVISIIPIIIVFLVLQKQFINGMAGAVKG